MIHPTNTNQICLCSCSPVHVVNLNIAVTDFSLFKIYDAYGNLHCNECLKWSYSMDGINWSCWLEYNDAAKILFESTSDYYVKVKVDFELGKIEYDNNSYDNWDASIAKCFEFGSISENPINSKRFRKSK